MRLSLLPIQKLVAVCLAIEPSLGFQIWGALCFEWGFTRTFPGNQDVAHCRKKIGDLLIVSHQIQIIRSCLGIKIAQFVQH